MKLYRRSRCRHCGRCISACPHGAVSGNAGDSPVFDHKMCDLCNDFVCINSCYSEALVLSGSPITLDSLLHTLERNRPFWGERGGVTFTGGEPFAQHEFLMAALLSCKERHISTCIETSGYVPREVFMQALKSLDWLFIDLKHMDPARHKELTGVDNAMILDNIRRAGSDLWDGFPVVRVPIVPPFNDTEENLRASARFVRSAGIEVIQLLPFHALGSSKYTALGWPVPAEKSKSPSPEQLCALAKVVENEGLTCVVGHNSFF